MEAENMANATSVLAAASYRDMPPDQVVFGNTRKMKELREKLDKLARTNIPVLIRGESGTGKEIIAQLIHRMSLREAGPFVKVTCSAIPGMPLESELFGYKKDALAGTMRARPEIVERAVQGTLFLDEIGDLSKGLQANLLQLLQDGQFSPIEGQEVDHVDVRMICATNRNLEEAIKSGSFRPDLFYRINVASIDLPPLRERKSDIQNLVEYFLDRYRKKFNCVVRPISPETLRSFEELSWPGNIRELENLIKRYVILGSESAICDGLTEPVTRTLGQTHSADGRFSLKKITKQASRQLEREIILQVLAENSWNRRRTARVLNISYRALLYKMKDAGVVNARVPDKSGKQ
jgi:two-component system, NtrC family, response regulator AtoC